MFDLQNSMSNMMSRYFHDVDGVVWDVMSNKMGIISTNGITSLVGTGDSATIQSNLMQDFGIAIPAFAISTPVSSVKVGDIVYRGPNNIAWIIDTIPNTNVKFKIMKPDGETAEWVPPNVSFMGMNTGGVMIVKSLLDTTGNSGAMGNIQQMVMAMSMFGGSMGSQDTLKQMIMMQMLPNMLNGGNAAITDPNTTNLMNPMMTMMFMKSLMDGNNVPKFNINKTIRKNDGLWNNGGNN